MKLLVVSDIASKRLEGVIDNTPEKLKDIDLIVSCGDLDREYLELIVNRLQKDMFFVDGNHDCERDDDDDFDVTAKFIKKMRSIQKKFSTKHLSGNDEMHGKMRIFKNHIIVGFGGSRWYNGRGCQYKESEMAVVVRKLYRKIRVYRWKDKLLGKPRKEVIVISHAPINGVHDLKDPCHTGFKCFHTFIKKTRPLLWLHGHVHLSSTWQKQVSMVNKTTVINCYGHKFVNINKKQIQVSPHN